MAWVTPPTFVDAVSLPAADLNILGADLLYLKGATDGITFSGAKADRAGAGSLSIPDATNTAVTLTNEVFDVGGWWSSGSTMTVPAAAIPSGFTTIAVLVFGLIRFVSNTTGGRALDIVVNATVVDGVGTGALSGDPTVVTFATFAIVSAGDTIGMEARQNSGGALNLDVAKLTVVRFQPVA